MRFAVIIGLCVTLSGQMAAAQTYEGCAPGEARLIAIALRDAKDLTLRAAVAVGDTPDYQRWFGDYTLERAETVRATLKSIVTALRTGAVTAQCEAEGSDGCRAGEYAYVFANVPYRMHLCPAYFTLPQLRELDPGARRSEYGTREGTIIHEVSHFVRVAGTEDHCYARGVCSDMAQSDARLAIENADTYQYFTEDVTYYARRTTAGKPPPAPRVNR